jgi:hypothetical protein
VTRPRSFAPVLAQEWLRGRRHCAGAITALVLLVAAGTAVESAPLASLSLRVSAPANVDASGPRDISVTIANGGARPAVVLPNMVRLRIDGAGAEYVPYPGPPVDPWAGARELVSGATATVLFRNASDRRGVWRLPPGRYRIIARYDVPPDLAPPATIADPDRIWRGRMESPPAMMIVDSG